MEQAIAKLETEMRANQANAYIQVVGGFLLQHLLTNPGAAAQINAEDKTIMKSLQAMRALAQTKQVGGCGVLTDQEGFTAVLKYYGIEGVAVSPTPSPVLPLKIEQKPTDDFSIDLDDLLS